MLTVPGPRQRFCDGSRRSFLKIGGLALGGLSLPQLLQAESQSGRRSHKAVIMVFLSGGPPHQDMIDLKPDAPAEVRSEFKPIATMSPAFRSASTCPASPRWRIASPSSVRWSARKVGMMRFSA